MNGWFYMWALLTSVAAVAVGAGPFLGGLLGVESSPAATTIIAVVLIGVATALNLLGTKLLARIAMFGFICELVGALAVGVWLLLFHRVHDFGVFFDAYGVAKGGSYLPAFLAAALVGLFTCYGFEACGDVAEEIHEPGLKIPKAMRMTIYVGMSASVFVCAALILATPDMVQVVAGKITNPVESVLRASFGVWGARAIIVVVLVSFVSCVLSLEAAVSRLLFAYGRDGMVAGSRYLAALSPRTHVPSFSLVLSGVIASVIAALGYFAQDALTTIIGFAVIGIYITFQMIVLGALIARMRGWKPSGHFRLGPWAMAINVGALIYGVAAIVNMMWPRTPDVPWYTNYSALLTSGTVLVIGGLYMILSRAYDNGSAPSGDAWTISETALAE
jgi:amino acid transporter